MHAYIKVLLIGFFNQSQAVIAYNMPNDVDSEKNRVTLSWLTIQDEK